MNQLPYPLILLLTLSGTYFGLIAWVELVFFLFL
jgi:hypothetical protein